MARAAGACTLPIPPSTLWVHTRKQEGSVARKHAGTLNACKTAGRRAYSVGAREQEGSVARRREIVLRKLAGHGQSCTHKTLFNVALHILAWCFRARIGNECGCT
eukprot:1158507-Pelagomonas_calceolata.AAC.14